MLNHVVPVFDRNEHMRKWVGQSTDITDRMQAEQRLQYLVSHEALTNPPNRALLMDRLNQALALALRRNRLIAVLFLDPDNFKGVNDTLEYGTGGLLLQAVARRLMKSERAWDTVARFGGDEFIVMLTDILRADDAGHMALNLLYALRRPFEAPGHSVTMLASVGTSVFSRNSADEETLLQHADAALYQAKDEGRCQYRQYSLAITTRTPHR
jgi:diguanylate cyclase (GGDEF)-like protein